MKRLAVIAVAALCSACVRKDTTIDYARYVDVFTGTAATGHTHPSASYPFGMVQSGPDTGFSKWEYCSGYQYGDTAVYGYSQTHLSGTGCPDYGDVQVLPFTGALGKLPMSRRIDKGSEKASPGYYTVRQPDDGLTIEIAAARRAAIYRFTWDHDGDGKVLVNLPFGLGDPYSRQGWSRVRTSDSKFNAEGNHLIYGDHWRTGWVSKRRVAYALEFNREWTDIERVFADIDSNGDEAPRQLLTFEVKAGKPLIMKVAYSTTEGTGALRNLADSIPDWDFEAVRENARAAWNELFSRTTCEGSDDQKANWYTALYHLYLQPNDWVDVDGRYRGADNQITQSSDGTYFTTLSLWDTFRAAQPWYTIATPEVVGPIVDSFLKHWRAFGRLPVMSYGGKNVDCMIGNHSIPVMVDAYCKGWVFDYAEAFVAMTNTLSVSHKGKPKEDWEQYLKYGYFPLDLNRGEGASRTLECAYDDACAAQFFRAMGKDAVAAEYAKRSQNWKNVFDRSIGFARGKDTRGRWRDPFSPFALAHENDWPSDFTEGNSWQYTWHVMQDPEGLIDALGGRGLATIKLDSLFKQDSSRREGSGFVSDVSGLIGQYAHGNEPSHHVIYLFQYMGRPDLTAKYIREVFDTQYKTGPDGLCGNDDCGQMSAWLTFSAMGFYPFNPCGGDYVIGAPQVPAVTMTLTNGKVFRMKAMNLSKENKYVRSVSLNGHPLNGFIIKHSDIMAGGELVFEMTDQH